MSKKLYVLFVIVVLITLSLTACGGASGGTVLPGQTDTTTQPAVGEETINQGINEFFQNDTQCSGIVC